MHRDLKNELDELGFVRLDPVVDHHELRSIASAFEAEGNASGNLRDAAASSHALAGLASHLAVLSIAETLLGPDARLVRSTLFDKTPDSNWKVSWHQDLTVEVAERHDLSGYGPWSLKGGVQCVQPPDSVLERIVTIRVRLDDCSIENGPIRVLPRTHLLGRIAESSIPEVAQDGNEVSCEGTAGSVLVMKPLLLHTSSASKLPSRRRVLHLDFAALDLAPPLEWRSGRSVVT